MSAPAPRPFADRLMAMIERRGPLCMGIDPYPDKIPALFGPGGPGSIAIWSEALIRRAAGKIAAVKPQVALFERWGAAGMAALEHACKCAADAGLIVILDAKRSDIKATAQGYADAYLGAQAACSCDAMTVTPYLGVESLEPFVQAAETTGRGVAVLVRTSNPGADDFQACLVDGKPLYVRVAEAMAPLIARLKGRKTSWSGLMLVVGATRPDDARLVRQHAPNALFLVPGFGAQGASAADALAGFVSSDHALVGGLVTASRSLIFPAAAAAAETGSEWEKAIDAALVKTNAVLRSCGAFGPDQ